MSKAKTKKDEKAAVAKLKRVVMYVEDDVVEWLQIGMAEAGLHSMSAHAGSIMTKMARSK